MLARMAYCKRLAQNTDTNCTVHAYSNYVFQDLTPNAVRSKAGSVLVDSLFIVSSNMCGVFCVWPNFSY